MATNNKRKTTSSSSRGRKKPAKKQAAPIRREVGACVCLVLALLTVLCCFRIDAAILNLLGSVFRGLIGAGFYILPFSFVMSFLILILHDGRPVALRVTCTFLTAALVGSLVQLVGGSFDAPEGWEVVTALWDGGISGTAGGVLSGGLASLLAALISRIGAVIVVIVGMLLSLITSLNMTVASIVTAIKNRPRAEYAEPQREHKDTAQAIVDTVATHHIEHVQRAEQRRASRMSEFDLPVDDPPLPEETPKKSAKRSAPMRPDVFVENSRRQAKPSAAPAQEPEAAEAPAAQAEPEAHTDYKSQFDALIADQPEPPAKAAEPEPEEEPAPAPIPNVIPMTQPRQMPPLIIDHFDAPKPEPQPAPSPEEPLPPLQTPEQPEKLKKADVQLEAAQIAQQITQQEPAKPEYQFPPVDLLKAGSGQAHDGTEEMRQNAERLSDTLQSFGIEAHIINVTRGPSVTRYELELQRGVKLSKVTNLADDIALALGASGVRIAAIPDKISVVGIEVPNRIVSVVMAREVIDSPEFAKHKSKVSFAVGKDIGGNRIIGDIGKLPHLLIAGTTGSGKSVCMNSLIISLLYKAKPEEVKLIMIDPKMVELGIYNGIPHLLIPVVTDPKKAAGSLQWAVTEMMRRYRMMADAGVRDLESYNKQARMSADDELEPMPQIVVVIDELADLMLVAAKEVEESICRIAQMGRASGIHLVIATQRPSADVITGLMKANIPSRIAFAVASAMESRIILDTAGAEKLVGKGDMLYAPLGQGKPKRVQGCFITDNEVQDVVTFIKDSSEAEYSDSVMAEIDKKAAESGKSGSGSSGSTAAETESSDGDEMLPAAVDVILETGQASVSMLQRRLKLGYARAARIMDEMEERGLVGPFEGSKPRQLLITREQWQAIKDGAPISSEPVEEEIP